MRHQIQAATRQYLMDDSDIAESSSLLFDSLVSSYQASYKNNAQEVGLDIGDDWQPSDTQQTILKSLADQQASQIADTYNSDIQQTISKYLDAYEESNGSIDEGAASGLLSMLDDWTSARSEWKSEQIANYTVGQGINIGTDECINDFLDSDADTSGIKVGVMPEDSSSDECAEYAGKMVPIDEEGDIPELPMHNNCPHYKIMISQ